MIIGYQGKKVAIYEVGGDLAAPKTTIDTSTVPSELLIYNDNICVCFQAVDGGHENAQQTHTDLTFIQLAEGFNRQTLRSKRYMRNAICGTDFFLANVADDKIVAWEWQQSTNGFIKGNVA